MTTGGGIRHRKRIEEAFGWAKTVGGMAQTVYRGLERVRARFMVEENGEWKRVAKPLSQ